MSFHAPTRSELAIHEAGHAYAFAALRPCDQPWEMGIARNDRGELHGWSRRATLLYREVPLEGVPADARPAIDRKAAAEIVITLAGPFAEFWDRHRRFRGWWILNNNVENFLRPAAFDTAGDFQKIRDVLDYVLPPDPAATFRWLLAVAEEVLIPNWRAARKLGRALEARGLLDEAFLEDWFERRPAKRYEGELAL